MGFRTPTGGNRKREEGFVNLIERLAACNGTKWSVPSILNEVLPEQRNLCEARHLLEPRIPTIFDKKRQITKTADDKTKLIRSVAPLRAILVPPRSWMGSLRADASKNQPLIMASDKATNTLREYVLTIWEDKFRLKCLAVEDVLFLLAHPSVANTLESASFLRESNLTYDQVMELEMALVMLRQQDRWSNAHSPKVSHLSLCDKLARNAWIHGRALPASRSSCVMLPEVIVLKRTLPRTVARAKLPQKQRMIPIKTGQTLATPKATTPQQTDCSLEIREWVRDHCMEEMARSLAMRKQFAVEKIWIVVSRNLQQIKCRRFAHWRQQTMWMQCQQQIRRFCQLKCALWVLQRSRKRLECAVFRLWCRWMVNVACQREDETIAATVAIQSWIRGVRGKHTAAIHHLHQAATLIQAQWRGIHSRRMFKRKKRFIAYNVAAHRVQRFYHSYLFRVRCTVWMKQQRAARVVTRACVRYIEKKLDYLAWCHHVARYRAAVSIQIWMRRKRKRIALAKAKHDRLANARRVLFNFFRYTRFIRSFGLRVESGLKRKTAAAVLLQNAYRAKQARARFYELKVHLEDQRRQEILTLMWNNAYATTIQKWWRKRKLMRRRQYLSKDIKVTTAPKVDAIEKYFR
ncbi:hypothetical protein PI125_g3889 [Phytophthora idaei]|nr:hypothetical protein PI125_g3889 [Phytophthora idaei]